MKLKYYTRGFELFLITATFGTESWENWTQNRYVTRHFGLGNGLRDDRRSKLFEYVWRDFLLRRPFVLFSSSLLGEASFSWFFSCELSSPYSSLRIKIIKLNRIRPFKKVSLFIQPILIIPRTLSTLPVPSLVLLSPLRFWEICWRVRKQSWKIIFIVQTK